MMNIFLIVIITPYLTDTLEEKSIRVRIKKVFPLISFGHSLEGRAYCTLLCFESYQKIPFSHTGRVDRGC